MFFISTPKSFKIGDSHDCRINDEPARITWKNAETLVIEPGDERAVIFTQVNGELRSFACGDSTQTGRSVGELIKIITDSKNAVLEIFPPEIFPSDCSYEAITGDIIEHLDQAARGLDFLGEHLFAWETFEDALETSGYSLPAKKL